MRCTLKLLFIVIPVYYKQCYSVATMDPVVVAADSELGNSLTEQKYLSMI